jgi:N-methylhydantoinase A
VVAVADARMEAALRRVSVERGHDPRGAALIAFGGAGGLHAAALAHALGCDAVVFPAWAGVLSALGALAAGARREKSRSVLVDAGDTRALDRAWAALEREALAGFARTGRGRVRVERWAEVRYRGQSHELSLKGGRGLVRRFHAEHARRFGFAASDRAVEVVTVEVRAEGPARWSEVLPHGRSPRSGRKATPVRRTRAFDDGAWRDVPVYGCAALAAGETIDGPALVEADGATLWLPRGRRGVWHPAGALIARERSR